MDIHNLLFSFLSGSNDKGSLHYQSIIYEKGQETYFVFLKEQNKTKSAQDDGHNLCDHRKYDITLIVREIFWKNTFLQDIKLWF